MNYQLDKQFLTDWIIALKSGKYTQSTGILKDNLGYCCLGVACEINNVEEDYLTNRATIWNDIGKLHPVLDPLVCSTLSQELIEMNDIEGISFNDIADWLQENVEGI